MQINAPNHRPLFCSGLLSHFIPFISGFSKSFSQTQGNFIPTPWLQPQATPQRCCLYIIDFKTLQLLRFTNTVPCPAQGLGELRPGTPVAPRTLLVQSPSGWVHSDICLSDGLTVICLPQWIWARRGAGGLVCICSVSLPSSHPSVCDLTDP